MVPERFRLRRQVVGVHANAVPADKARRKGQEVPLRPRRRQDVGRPYLETVTDERELVHERDVQVSLCVLEHLGHFRDLDRGRDVNAGRDNGTVKSREGCSGFGIAPGNDFRDPRKAVLPVARVDAFRGISNEKIGPARKSGFLFEEGRAKLLGQSRIHRRFVHDDRATLQVSACDLGSEAQRAKVGSLVRVDRCRNADNKDIGAFEVVGIVCEGKVRGSKFIRRGFAGPVFSASERLDATRIYVEANRVGEARPEAESDRKANISETQDCNAFAHAGVPFGGPIDRRGLMSVKLPG